MNNRSFLLSALLAGGILASAGLPASALPAAAAQDAIVHSEAAPPMVEQAYWGWHRRHYWHRPYWHRWHHRHYWHRW